MKDRIQNHSSSSHALCFYNGSSFSSKFLNTTGEKEVKDAGSLTGATPMLLMAKYGTTIGIQ